MRKEIGSDKPITYVAYRKVNFDFSPKVSEDLDTFLEEIAGKSYGLFGTGKLIREQSTVLDDNDKN